MNRTTKHQVSLLLAGALLGGVLSFYRLSEAAPPETAEGQTPLRNPIAQRDEMIRELREIKTLLREQTALLQRIAEAK